MPFVSDKQRKYLWSQKPEVAKKFAEHKADGGEIETHWPNGKPKSEEQLAYERRVIETNKRLAKDPLAQTALAISPLALPLAVDKGIKTGEWGDAALEGAGALAGPLGAGALKLGKNAWKAAPLISGAFKQGFDPDYARLAAEEIVGIGGRPAKSVGASANFGEVPVESFARQGHKVESINPAWSASNPRHQAAAQAIGTDAARVSRGVPEVGTPSKVVKDFEVGGKGQYGEALDPNDLVGYSLPDAATWNKHFPDVPMPTQSPIVQVAKRRGGNRVPMSAIPHETGMYGGKYRPGKSKFKSKAGPLAGKTVEQVIGTTPGVPKNVDPRRLAALKAAGLI